MAILTAVLVAVALGGYPVLRAGTLYPLSLSLSALGLFLLALALGGFLALLPWALSLLALGYVIIDLARSEPLLVAPFYGAGLLLMSELVYASRELRRGREEQPLRRLWWLLAVTATALAVAFLPVLASALTPPHGLVAELIASSAAIALLGIPSLLVRRRSA